MVRRRTPAREQAEGGNGPQVQEEPRARNGAGERADGSSESGTAAPAVARAEEVVDRMAERVGHYASVLGHKLLWLAARAREEAEDIWAEAQALRRGQRP